MVKKILCLLLTLFMSLLCLCAAFADGTATILDYDELPEAHRARFEEEVANALANAPNRVPGMNQLIAKARGAFNGYTGTKTQDGITVNYTVSDSMVTVGEAIKLEISITSSVQPFVFTISGLVMDANFGNAKRFNTESVSVEGGTWTKTISYTPTEVGYVNFALAITDSTGEAVQVGVSTATVQVYEDEEPLFKNIAIEGSTVVILSLDDNKTRVGEVITATATFTAEVDPVKYDAVWKLVDAQGNVLDEKKVSGQCSAQETIATVHFDYWPLQEGEVQFSISAVDGAGNKVGINTPYVTVQDGFYFTAELDKAAVSVGESLTGSYHIYGHTCESTKYIVGWTCYDAADPDKILYTVSSVVENRSGKASFTPRFGETIEFYVRASCDHYPDVYPAYDSATLLYGVQAELSLSATTVKSGNSISLNYSVNDGLTPYQRILINGYSVDQDTNETYNFFQQSVTAAEGKVTGKPYLGNAVYFEVKVTESDGYVSTWRSNTIPLTGAPDATAPVLSAAVAPESAEVGETITLTYQMTGGSGSINKTDTSGNYVAWKKVDGTIVASKTLTGISGTATFTPDEAGEYLCIVMLTDGYNQRVTWSSDSIYVGDIRIPGDADDSGSVNLTDAQLVIRHSADSTVTLNASNADVNTDGKVDLNDALLLLQFVAGWDVKLR